MSASQNAALLIHGFTATPACLESLAIPLRKAGYLVEAPLLRGHGGSVADLAKATWQDWFADVQAAHDRLKKQVDRVCIAGLSLGGLLALRLALDNKGAVLALLAAPLFFQGWLARFVLPLLDKTGLKELYRYQTKWDGPAIADPVEKAKFVGYPKMPIAAILQIVHLQKELAGRLPEITLPTLLIHSRHDTTVPFANLGYLQEHLGSKKIDSLILERSNHILTMDYDRELVAQKVLSFFTTIQEENRS